MLARHGNQRNGQGIEALVLVADPISHRRQQLARSAPGLRALEAASLGEAFPIAEEAAPAVIALAIDFAAEPELEGIVRLARALRSTVFLYSGSDRGPAVSTPGGQLPCIPMATGDSIRDLLARMADQRTHLAPAENDLRTPDLIVIGASTGGVVAIETVLSSFPRDCPPTLVVQHIRAGFIEGMVKRLDASCRPRVVEATDGLQLARGTVYFAADTSRHLTVSGPTARQCVLVDAPPRHGHRPAVDTLFESAQQWGPRAAAALLTGMGRDGADGMVGLHRQGAYTVAQDRDSSVVWGMPGSAVAAGAAKAVLPVAQIGAALLAARPRPMGASQTGGTP